MSAEGGVPPAGPSASCVVVGAGLSGLVCARDLTAAGLRVDVLDKGRAPAGRMATRRAEHAGFDHGAQYFTAHDPAFAEVVRGWEREGVAAPWRGRIVQLSRDGTAPARPAERFVGVPAMSAVPRRLADGLDVRRGVRVTSLARGPDGWRVRLADGRTHGPYAAAVVTCPAPQAAELLRADAPELTARADAAPMSACWAVLARFARQPGLPFDGAFVEDAPLSWAARNDSKPGRGTAPCWVLHGAPAWSDAHLGAEPAQVVPALLSALEEAAGRALPPVADATAHLWRFALPQKPLEERCLLDEGRLVGACGDWCGGPRVEGAWLSGKALARRLLGALRAV